MAQVRPEDLKRGQLIKITLNSGAVLSSKDSMPFYYLDSSGEHESIPGRTFPRYVSRVEGDAVLLADGWNMETETNAGEYRTVRYYFNAIDSCSMLFE